MPSCAASFAAVVAGSWHVPLRQTKACAPALPARLPFSSGTISSAAAAWSIPPEAGIDALAPDLPGLSRDGGYNVVNASGFSARADGSMAEYDHVPGLRKQLERTPRALPKLTIAKKPFEELTFEDFELTGYEPDPPISFKVAV